MSADQIENFFALAIGFGVAGVLASAYQLVTGRPASFGLLQRGPQPATFAAVPLLAFTAPFIIMRNIVRGRRRQDRGFRAAMTSTIIAGVWSLMSGTAVLMALAALG